MHAKIVIYKVIGSLPKGNQYRRIPLRFDPSQYKVGDLQNIFGKFDRVCAVFPYEALHRYLKGDVEIKVRILLPMSLIDLRLLQDHFRGDGKVDMNRLINRIVNENRGFLDYPYIDVNLLPSIGTYGNVVYKIHPSIITTYLYTIFLEDFHDGYTHFMLDISTGLNVYNSLAELAYRDAIIYMKIWKGLWGDKRGDMPTYMLFIEPVLSGGGECTGESKEIYLEHVDPQPLILWPPKLDRMFREYSDESIELKIFDNGGPPPRNIKELIKLLIHTKKVFKALEENAPLILFRESLLLKNGLKSPILDYKDVYSDEIYYVNSHIKTLTNYIIEKILSSLKISSKSDIIEISAEELGKANYTLVRAITYGIAISKLLHVNYGIPLNEPYIEDFTLSSNINNDNWLGSFKKILDIYKDLGLDSNSALLKKDLINIGSQALKGNMYSRPSYYRSLWELKKINKKPSLIFDIEWRNFRAHSGMLEYITLVRGTYKGGKIQKLEICYGKVDKGKIKTEEEKLKTFLENLLLGRKTRLKV